MRMLRLMMIIVMIIRMGLEDSENSLHESLWTFCGCGVCLYALLGPKSEDDNEDAETSDDHNHDSHDNS